MREYFATTQRIGFSQWTRDDLPLAALLWGDGDVTRYLCAGGKFTGEEIHDRLIREAGNQRDINIQYWPIFELATGELIGCCGLRPFRMEEKAYEIGFHLRKKYWGKGYAFEAAAAVIDHAFGTLKASRLVAGHHPQNTGSQKLLLRLGFQYTGDELYPPTGLYHPAYELWNAKIRKPKER